MPYHCRIQYILSFQIILRFVPYHIVKCIKSFHTLDHFNLKQTTSYHIMFFISFLFHVLFLNLNHIISNRINQCQIYHIIPNIVSCHNIYRFTSCHSQSYDFMSFLDPSHIIWNHYHIISYHIIPYHIMSFRIISYVMSYHVSFHIEPFHIRITIIYIYMFMYHMSAYRSQGPVLTWKTLCRVLAVHVWALGHGGVCSVLENGLRMKHLEGIGIVKVNPDPVTHNIYIYTYFVFKVVSLIWYGMIW